MNSPEDIKKRIVLERERLAIQFTRKKLKKWWHYDTHYKLSTWDVANTKPYLEYPIDKFVAYYPKHLAKIFGAVAIITALVVFIFQDAIEDSLQFFLVILIFVAGFISYNSIPYDRNRHPQILINYEGIYIARIDALIKWCLLVDTYIRVEDNGDDGTSYFLNVYYYCLDRNNFFDTEIPLQEIQVAYKKLSYAIEYIKMNREIVRDM